MIKKRLFLFVAAAFLCVFFLSPLCWADKDLDDVRHAIKQKGAKWFAGETSMTRLSHAERQKRLGLIHSFQPEEEPVVSVEAPAFGLPLSLDWRNNGGNYVTPIRDQGSCGSCWAFAATGALESNVLISSQSPGVDLNLSEQVLVSCGNAGSCGGGNTGSASSFIQNTGLPVESCYPYTATDGSCGNACAGWQFSSYRISSYKYLASGQATVEIIKNGLYNYGPLVTSMAVYNDFFSYYGGIYSYVSGALAGYHAIVIVGYDDPGQYFIVKNSWGTWWGESGYFRIAYSELGSPVTFGRYVIAYLGTGPTCSYSVGQPYPSSFPASGGNGSVNVATSDGCAWTAASNAGWINITSGSSGTGNGNVGFSVGLNAGAPRAGTLTIAGQTYTVTQQGQNCSYSITPSSQTFVAAGGAGTVDVTATPLGCSWTAVSNAAWISVSSTNNGAGPVYYSVGANSGTASRSGTMTIAGQPFTVNQAGGCSISISPASQSFPGAGGNGLITVTATGTACSWTAKSNASWITLKSVDTVAGSVAYSVAPNTKNARTGTITIGNKSFTVKQAKRNR